MAGAGIVLGVLLVLAFRQTFIYHDLETLYRDTIEKNPQSSDRVLEPEHAS